jgi:hypothetical protein
MHLLSYTALVANACRPLTDVLVHGGALVVVLGVESFGQMVKYDARDNEEGQGGILLGSKIGDKSDHLFQGEA